MASQVPISSGVLSEVDKAASAACIRSGAFALLISVALFLLIPYWRQEPNFDALRTYVAYRLNLAAALDTLDDSAVWQRYKEGQEAAESMSIAQLAEVRVNLASTGTSTAATAPPRPDVKQTPHLVGKNEAQHAGVSGRRPAPPTNLSVTVHMEVGIDELPRIVDALSKLNDSDALTRTRRVSNFFDFSIIRWVNKRNTLLYRNVVNNHCTPKELEVPTKGNKPDHFVPALTQEALLNCLTLRDVRELGKLELPAMSNPMELGGHVGGVIDVTPGSLPRDPYLASLVAQGLLLFMLVYFGAFASDAVSSAGFPTPGTLFGAFGRSYWTRLVFVLALWSPFVACAAVAYYSHKWPLWGCAVLVGVTVLSVHLVLQRKSYFGRWSFRALA